MALAPFFTQRSASFHCRKPLASAVPEINISVRLVKDHLALGMSGTGKLAMATASGISPDLNFSTMVFSTLLTLSFMGFTSLKVQKALREPKEPFVRILWVLWDSGFDHRGSACVAPPVDSISPLVC